MTGQHTIKSQRHKIGHSTESVTAQIVKMALKWRTTRGVVHSGAGERQHMSYLSQVGWKRWKGWKRPKERWPKKKERKREEGKEVISTHLTSSPWRTTTRRAYCRPPACAPPGGSRTPGWMGKSMADRVVLEHKCRSPRRPAL